MCQRTLEHSARVSDDMKLKLLAVQSLVNYITYKKVKMNIFTTEDATTPNIECDKSVTHERQRVMLSLCA